MKILLNGNSINIQKELTLESLVKLRGFEPSKVVVELNGDIANSAQWTTTMLTENDRIELISFVGGG